MVNKKKKVNFQTAKWKLMEKCWEMSRKMKTNKKK